MANSMTEIISINTIKPFSQTPSSLRLFKLSPFDRYMPNIYVPVSFLFCSSQNHNNSPSSCRTSQKSLKLQDALSRTLSYYFPFAGKLKDEEFVDCNDDGVLFLEVLIKKPMSPAAVEYHVTEDLVFPRGFPWGMSNEGYLAVFQLSHFECGGMAIGACISHRLADASTITTFINDWALMARHSGRHLPCPHFIGESIFKPVNSRFDNHNLPPKSVHFPQPHSKAVTRTYIFYGRSIAELKSSVAAESSGVEKPTRVEVVVAFLLNRLMSVVNTRRPHDPFRPCVLYQLVNMRPLVTPVPMPENSIGNLVSRFGISATNENEMGFSQLVGQLRNEKIKLRNVYKVELANDFALDASEMIRNIDPAKLDSIKKDDLDLYFCSSWCGFPLHQVDFGWGRPSQVCGAAKFVVINTILLMDTPSGDGIQATLALEEQVMSMFECDPELLKFASP